MKLISWNVNGLRACMGKGFLEFVAQQQPDMLCLQETKMQQGQADVPLEGGYHEYWNSAEKKGYSGVALFTKHRVYTRTEMEARYEIHLENYSKVLNIEALTMLEMARRDIMPAVSSYLRELSETAAAIHAASVTADCSYEESIIPEMSALLGDAYRKVRSLDEALMGAKTVEGSQALANYYRDKVFSAMAELRITIDQLETMMPSDKWPVPSYGDLLFSVR